MNIAKKTLAFLNEVKVELFKITWPSKDEVLGTIIIVCILTLVFAALLGGMDVVFGFLIKKLM